MPAPNFGISTPYVNAPGTPAWYVNLGLDPAGSGLWQIVIAPSPASAFKMGGYAKKLLKNFLLQDLINNVPFDYFPDGIIEDLLIDGVKAGISAIQGYSDAARLDAQFEAKLAAKVKEQANAGKDNSGIITPPPDSYRWKQRMRSKWGSGVY